MSLALAILALTACTPDAAPRVLRPETIGVVQATEPLGGSRFRVELESGVEVQFDSNGDPLGGPPFPEPGTLLLIGDGSAWFAVAEPVGDCFVIAGSASEVEGDAVLLDSGLRLDLAPDSIGAAGAGGPTEHVDLCLDSQGRFVGVCSGIDGGC